MRPQSCRKQCERAEPNQTHRGRLKWTVATSDLVQVRFGKHPGIAQHSSFSQIWLFVNFRRCWRVGWGNFHHKEHKGLEVTSALFTLARPLFKGIHFDEGNCDMQTDVDVPDRLSNLNEWKGCRSKRVSGNRLLVLFAFCHRENGRRRVVTSFEPFVHFVVKKIMGDGFNLNPV